MAVDSRVLWRCRRGIRELDIAFARFVEGHYAALTPAQNAAFERLLLENDLEHFEPLLELAIGRVPAMQTAGIKPGSITLAQIEGHLAKHDPQGRARDRRTGGRLWRERLCLSGAV